MKLVTLLRRPCRREMWRRGIHLHCAHGGRIAKRMARFEWCEGWRFGERRLIVGFENGDVVVGCAGGAGVAVMVVKYSFIGGMVRGAGKGG